MTYNLQYTVVKNRDSCCIFKLLQRIELSVGCIISDAGYSESQLTCIFTLRGASNDKTGERFFSVTTEAYCKWDCNDRRSNAKCAGYFASEKNQYRNTRPEGNVIHVLSLAVIKLM